MINKIRKVAVCAIKRAGSEALKRYRRFDRRKSHLKKHYEIVTAADLVSEKIIIREIKKYFPGHHILSEEKGSVGKEGEYLWAIDPIDGTTNFSMRNPLWSVSIGIFYRSEIIFGVVCAPVMGELFTAEKGRGAFLNGKRIRVSRIRGGSSIHAFCHGREKKDIALAVRYLEYQKSRNVHCRQMGSAAIELAHVACGRIESIMIPGAHTWDVAAGALIVKEAGGKVSDLFGKKWVMESGGILASNGRIHREILAVIKKLKRKI